MEWTLDRIFQLASNPLLLDRARQLLKPRLWPLLEFHQSILWGTCRTSGVTRYRIAFDLQQGYFFSNSPAPSKPDKYIIALVWLFFEDPSLFKYNSNPPEWVSAGLTPATLTPSSTNAHQPDQAETPLAVSDKRIAQMAEGRTELATWLHDNAFQGLGTLQTQDDSTWEAFSARLTDAKLSGLAKRVRRMKLLRHTEAWNQIFLQELAALHLWSEAFARIDELPEPLQQELMIQGGWNPRKEDVLREGINLQDDWLVLAQQVGMEDQLRFRKIWFWGVESGKTALCLEYAWGDTPFDRVWPTGVTFRGSLFFYPAALPMRVVPGSVEEIKQDSVPKTGMFDSFTILADAFARAAAQNPWLEFLPCFVNHVRVIRQADTYLIVDTLYQQLRLDIPTTSKARYLLNIPFPQAIFGTWNGIVFTPLCAIQKDQLITW